MSNLPALKPTPWSTFVPYVKTASSTPCITPVRKPHHHPSMSPSPVAHSNSSLTQSPEGTPSLDDFAHDSVQLPSKKPVGAVCPILDPVDVVEAFIASLPDETKKRVRDTYPAEPKKHQLPPTLAPSPVVSSSKAPSRLSISGNSYLVDPSFASNRFLQPYNALPTRIYSSVSYVPLNRGC